MMLAIVGGLLILGFCVYVVRVAGTLKAMADALRDELRQFKEGGFDRLIGEKLNTLAQAAHERERILQAEGQRAADATVKFQRDLGAIQAQIDHLRGLQDKVGELNDLLKPQQLRGELGEVIVRALITDKLPRGQYEEDFAFADGKRVEFALRVDGKLISVDSKLQLEEFRRMRAAPDERQRQLCRTEFKRTVRLKIDEVKQYIRPEEGTWNFALMVIPSEAVYYELITSKDFTEPGGVGEYAQTRHVFLVSPSTFWAYLTVLAQGLRGLEIGRRAEEILASLQTVASKIRGFSEDEFRKLGEHLRNAATQYEKAERKLANIEGSVSALEHVGAEEAHPQGITV